MTRISRKFPAFAGFCAPLMLAVAVAAWGHGQQRADTGALAALDADERLAMASPPRLEQVQVRDARELRRLFAELGYVWPPAPGPSVPRVAVDPLPDDFAWPAEIEHKKRLFFKVLMPLALAENARVLRQRELLLTAIATVSDDGAAIGDDHPAWQQIGSLARDYQLEGEPNDPALHASLLSRVDAVPVELVLAQAANESGWGDSRFAREGNNLFGVWTFRAGTGIVPAERPEGETYAVRRYETLRASVRSHIFNLNIGHAYEDLRTMRAEMRAQGVILDAIALAGGLERYSIRGQDYIDEIRAIIRVNDLTTAARARLRDAPLAAAPGKPSPLNLQVAATTAD